MAECVRSSSPKSVCVVGYRYNLFVTNRDWKICITMLNFINILENFHEHFNVEICIQYKIHEHFFSNFTKVNSMDSIFYD